MRKPVVNLLIFLVLGAVVLFAILQFVPYGRSHINPSVIQEPQWSSVNTRDLVKRACFDCHSNETVWPWYSNIAPISWLVQHDVNEGREKLNFSDITHGEQEWDDIEKVLRTGEMPPRIYILQHPEARLNSEETQALIDGLRRTTGFIER